MAARTSSVKPKPTTPPASTPKVVLEVPRAGAERAISVPDSSASVVAGALLLDTRKMLSLAGDPERARGQQAYMKSEMPYHGVTSPEQRKIFRALFATHVFNTIEAWQEAVMLLWREARFREERYAAIELSGARMYKDFQVIDVLPMYEEMIVTGAWWDLVDVVAIHRVGPLLQAYRKPMTATMRAWSKSSNLWKRRTAIICQVAAKKLIDLDLLYAVIAPNLADKDFFVRKAIGWSLRSHAWVDADEVAKYVARHRAELSGLSYREAVKNIDAETLSKAAELCEKQTRPSKKK